MNLSLLRQFLPILLVCFIGVFSLSAQDNLDEGKNLFKANCATCHNKSMKDDMTGPALAGLEERWAEYSREDLYAWIRNSSKLIGENHPRATQLFADWDGSVMTSFTALTDENIENIIGYINAEAVKVPPVVAVTGGGGEVASNGTPKILYLFLIGVLGALALVLARVISHLNHGVRIEEGGIDSPRPSIMQSLFNKTFISFLLFGLLLFLGYKTVNNAIGLGRQQGYQPEQPINFSHKIHAGDQKIDCQYCHDGARRSKHSVIPAASTCMNCHKAVLKGTETGTSEISKIFASIGFDPTSGKMIDGYENYSEKQIEELFKKWIAASYLKETGEDSLSKKWMALKTITDEDLEDLNRKGLRQMNDEWEGIKTSLTNEHRKTIPGPIEWIRIHNLPDHVYFNHSQHVAVGGVECQACHGAVEEMDVVEQHAPLSMGWCINCHRESEVKGFANNDYYAETYERYHNALANKEIEKVTVEDIGGLECQKCHY